MSAKKVIAALILYAVLFCPMGVLDRWLHRNDWKITMDEQHQCYGYVNYDGSVRGSFSSSNDAYEVMLVQKKWSEDYDAGRIRKQKHNWKVLP